MKFYYFIRITCQRFSVFFFYPPLFLKAGKSGFHNLIFIPQSHRALCTFVDGSVGVFNLTSREMEFSTPPGHNETIFDVSYCPTEPHTLATSSYDSTVKIWNTYTMEMKQVCNLY